MLTHVPEALSALHEAVQADYPHTMPDSASYIVFVRGGIAQMAQLYEHADDFQFDIIPDPGDERIVAGGRIRYPFVIAWMVAEPTPVSPSPLQDVPSGG